MRKTALSVLVIAIIGILCLPLAAGAESRSNRRAWTSNDTLFEALFGVLVYVDWKQTIEFTQNPYQYPNCHETNPFLGHHPSRTRINAVMGASLAAHALIAYALPQPYRGVWQFVWIGIEADVIHTNTVVTGVAIRF